MIFQLSFFIYILQSFYLIGFNNLSNKLGESFNKTEGRSGELYSAFICRAQRVAATRLKKRFRAFISVFTFIFYSLVELFKQAV